MVDQPDDTPWWERKGTKPGLALIAYGLIGGVYDYYRDSTSRDFYASGNAVQGAILHAVPFSLAGLAVIGWYRLHDPQE
jgi:hypothetical protein